MTTKIYLTEDEQKLYAKLPEGLRDGWTVESESLKGMETPDQIRMRYHMMSADHYGMAKTLAAQVLKGAKLTDLSLDDVPTEFLPKFYFTIGARGVSAIIWDLLSRIKTDEDIQGLCGFTLIRRELLAMNSSVPAV